MMDGKKHFPCVWTRSVGGRVLATVGMSLESLLAGDLLARELRPEEVGTSSGQSYPQASFLWDSSLRLLKNLMACDEMTSLELNLTSWPYRGDLARGRVDITLTLNTAAATKKKATEEVLARYLPFFGLLLSHLPWATFSPITDAHNLMGRLEPFEVGHCVGIVRRREPVSLALPLPVSASSLGFMPKTERRSSVSSETAAIDHLFPWTPSMDPLDVLVDFLLCYPEPVTLRVGVRRHPHPEREHRLLLQTIQGIEELMAATRRPGEVVLSDVASDLKGFVLKRLAELTEGQLQLSTYVCSRGALDEVMVQALVQSFLASNRGTGSEQFLRGGWDLKQVEPKQLRNPDFAPDERAFSFSEAACFFRLPWPPLGSLLGLPIRRWRSVTADLPKPKSHEDSPTTLGLNVHRGNVQCVEVLLADRMRHMYIVGQTGTGKSTFMESLIIQDLCAGRGLCLIDPHGELVEAILHQYPTERDEDLILVDLTDHDYPFALNLLAWRDFEERDRIIDELFSAVGRMYDLSSVGGPMFEKHFRGMLRLLMGDGEGDFVPTLLDLPLLYTDKGFREFCLAGIKDEQIHHFLEEADKVRGDHSLENMSLYVTSKISRFTHDRRLRRIFGQKGLSLDFRQVIDQGKVVLINLGRGTFGENVSALVASQLVGRFKAAAMARAKVPVEKRREFLLYVDEFQNVAHENFADLLAEARKYKMGLVLANQYTGQLDREWFGRRDSMLSSILGNVGMVLAFRVGLEDAEKLASVFAPAIRARDLMELPNWEGYLKVHLGDRSVPAFNIRTRKPRTVWDPERVERLRQMSRQRYCRPAHEVDKEISERWRLLRMLSD